MKFLIPHAIPIRKDESEEWEIEKYRKINQRAHFSWRNWLDFSDIILLDAWYFISE